MITPAVSLFEENVLKHRRRCRIYSALAVIAVPVAYGLCTYLGAPDAWISKSGAVTSVFAILAAQKAQMMGDAIRPSGDAEGDAFINTRAAYKDSVERHLAFATWLAIAGAIGGVVLA